MVTTPSGEVHLHQSPAPMTQGLWKGSTKAVIVNDFQADTRALMFCTYTRARVTKKLYACAYNFIYNSFTGVLNTLLCTAK